jgi:hypothetical protein
LKECLALGADKAKCDANKKCTHTPYTKPADATKTTPDISIKSTDKKTGKVFLTATAGKNYKKTIYFTFSDGTKITGHSVTCPLAVEVIDCKLECKYDDIKNYYGVLGIDKAATNAAIE